MPENYIITGDNSIQFGTAAVGYTEIGEIVSASEGRDSDKVELKNRYGNTFAQVSHNGRYECEVEAIFNTDYTLPTEGDFVTICGKAGYIIQKFKKKWQAGKEAMFTIDFIKFDHLAA